jgi:hypothetical protein
MGAGAGAGAGAGVGTGASDSESESGPEPEPVPVPAPAPTGAGAGPKPGADTPPLFSAHAFQRFKGAVLPRKVLLTWASSDLFPAFVEGMYVRLKTRQAPHKAPGEATLTAAPAEEYQLLRVVGGTLKPATQRADGGPPPRGQWTLEVEVGVGAPPRRGRIFVSPGTVSDGPPSLQEYGALVLAGTAPSASTVSAALARRRRMEQTARNNAYCRVGAPHPGVTWGSKIDHRVVLLLKSWLQEPARDPTDVEDVPPESTAITRDGVKIGGEFHYLLLVRACVRVQANTCARVHTHACAHTCAHTRVRACVHVHVCSTCH